MKRLLFAIYVLTYLLCLVTGMDCRAQIVVNNGDIVKNPALTGYSCYSGWHADKDIGMSAAEGLTIPDFVAYNPGTTPITATISVAQTRNHQVGYVINQLSGKVWVFGGLQQAITADAETYALVSDLSRDHLYITNRSSGTVTVVRLTYFSGVISYIVTATIPVGKGASGIVMSPDGTTLYVANATDNTVSVIDPKTSTVKATIPISSIAPTGVAISPDGKTLYVTDAGSSNITVINTANNSISGVLTAGVTPQGIVISPDGKTLYVTNQGTNSVSVINTVNGARTAISVGNMPLGVAITLDGSRVYVANQGSDKVSVISTASGSQIATIDVGSQPTGVSVSPDGSVLYVTNFHSNDVTIINTSDNSIKATYESDNLGGHAPFNALVTGSAGCLLPFTYTITVNPTPPTIKVAGNVPALSTSMGAPSPSGSFTVSGLSLTAGVTATAPAGYEVSTDNINFSNSVVIGDAGNVEATPVYVRIAGSAAQGSSSVNITLSSGAATPVAEPVSGTVTEPVPAIIVGLASGKIKGCEGSPSTSTQQFVVSAVSLNGTLSATAPAGFEVSTSATGGFANHIDISSQKNVPNTTIYVRSSGAVLGNLSGNITVSIPSAFAGKKVAVLGAVYPTPKINPVASQVVVASGAPTKKVIFTGTGNTYNWFSTGPGIGLDPSGTGDIASFSPFNKTDKDLIDTITAIPVSTTLAYITNMSNNSVSVVNVATNVQIATIAVGSSPQGVLLSVDATRAYVANAGSNDVSVINTGNNTEIARVKVGQSPQGMEFSADGKTLYVYNSYGATVTAINTADNSVISNSDAGKYPPGTPISPDGKTAYVYDYLDGAFIVYDIKSGKAIGGLGSDNAPGGLVLSPDGSLVYVMYVDKNTNGSQLHIVDAKNLQTIKTIDIGPSTFSRAITITPDGSTLYIANGYSNNISVINTATYEIVATLDTDHFPFAAASTGGTGCSGNPITFTITVEPVPPTITATGTLTSLSTVKGNPSQSASFTVSGIRMQAGITVGPLNGFEFSTDNTSFSSTIIVGAAGTIANTTVYVRLAASDNTGNYSGNISLSSARATTVTVATDGTNTVYEPVATIQINGVSGIIVGCAGMPSASPSIKQFTVNGFKLLGPIKVDAPTGFEVSLNAASAYASTLSLPPDAQAVVTPTIIYVRSAATAPAGTNNDKVRVSSSLATDQNIPVTSVISALPSADQVPDQTVAGGQATNPVNFTGTANTYSWINSNPGIGLAANGYGNIASFTTINKGVTQLTAKVIVTPIAAALAYIANSGSPSVSLINTGSGALVTTIPLGAGSGTPFGVAVSPDGRRIYVTNLTTDNISVVDAISNTVAGNIKLAATSRPRGILISPDGKTLYVADNGLDNVSVIDIASGTIKTIGVGIGPYSMALSPDGNTLYVANHNAVNLAGNITKGISVINLATGTVTTYNTGRSVTGLALSPDGKELYETNAAPTDNSVWVINTANGSVYQKISVGSTPQGITISADGKMVYVTNSGSGTVSVINTSDYTVASIKVGNNPQGVAISPDGTVAYVVNGNAAGTISVIQTATNMVSATITAGNTPLSFGNFISAGLGCPGNPMSFSILVNPTSPYITPTGTLTAMSTDYGTPSAPTSFTVSGISMTAAITATAPVGFEVSLDNKTFSSSVSFGAAGAIVPTTVYVRIAATAEAGTYTNGVITLSSSGATDTPEPIPASAVNAINLTITADNKSKVAGAVNPVLTATYSGFVNGDTKAKLTTLPTLTTSATQSSPVGQYPIDVSGAVSTNYTFTYIPGILTVNLGEQQIAIPNAFTPNGDGVNDTWMIPALATYTNFTVNIFNRQGQSLYYSNNYPIPWDGMYKGAPLPTGVYYYIINIKGASKPFSGEVVIIR